MKRWLREFLGLHDVIDAMILHASDLHNEQQRNINDLKIKLDVTNRAVGHLVAKLDPILGVSELDPKRKEASDKLGDEVIKRLEADAKVQGRIK